MFHVNVSIFLPFTKGVSLLEQNQLFQLLKIVEILLQNVNFEIVCSITVPQRRRKKSLLYKTPIYLPIEDIKPLRQNS